MPACARKETVREGEPGIYHCWSRCVRRAYLLGQDPLTGKNHSHRRQWVIERLELLAANFVIDVCFLAVLANHLHLVLRSTPRLVQRMGTGEVARRWLRVFPGKRVLDGDPAPGRLDSRPRHFPLHHPNESGHPHSLTPSFVGALYSP